MRVKDTIALMVEKLNHNLSLALPRFTSFLILFITVLSSSQISILTVLLSHQPDWALFDKVQVLET